MSKTTGDFGIRVELPAGDPLAAPHLLGQDWQGTRWYATERERDAAYESMLRQPGNYRRGDHPSIVVTRIERQA